ncbi:MAG: ribosome silencing factor [Phycisphaerales bacterium]
MTTEETNQPPHPDESLGVERASMPTTVDPERSEQARRFAIEAARTLHDDKCEQVVVLDLRKKSQITEYFVIATGTSERQMRSAGHDVAELGEQMDMPVFRSNLTETGSNWVIVDCVDVIAHVFSPEQRTFYDLEMLWGDAKRVDWSRPGEEPAPGSLGRDRAGIGPNATQNDKD